MSEAVTSISKLPPKYKCPAVCLKSLPDLTSDRLNAVHNYSNHDYERINQALREGRSLDQFAKKYHENMLTMLCPTKRDTVLWRGVSMSDNSDTNPFEAGKWIDPAWVSTSMIKMLAREFGDCSTITNYLMRLHVPKGIHVVPTASILYAIDQLSEKTGEFCSPEFLCEREITLQPGLVYEVKNRRRVRTGNYRKDYYHLDVTVSAK